MKKLKKLLLLLLVGTTLVSLTACGEKTLEGKLSDLMESIYKDVYADLAEEERPMLGDINVLTDVPDNVEYYIGAKANEVEYEEIYVREPMMGSIAHSVVLVRMKDGADIETAKKAIKEGVDPRKWICVEVPKEDVIVKSRGNIIVLIMVADETTRNRIEEGFDNL